MLLGNTLAYVLWSSAVTISYIAAGRGPGTLHYTSFTCHNMLHLRPAQCTRYIGKAHFKLFHCVCFKWFLKIIVLPRFFLLGQWAAGHLPCTANECFPVFSSGHYSCRKIACINICKVNVTKTKKSSKLYFTYTLGVRKVPVFDICQK
jgi:hypothetical protein